MNGFVDILNTLVDWIPYSVNAPLLFTRKDFWLFFVIVYAVFVLLYRNNFRRNTWLFAVSLFFYYKSSGLFFILIVFSVVINFLIGKKIDTDKLDKYKKRWVALAVIYNLSWLVYFKYTYFFTGIINQWFGLDIQVTDWLVLAINQTFRTGFDAASIILPVGISFYTFQIISYILDLYRGKVKAVKNVLDFGFYVTFFPQLIAGPIVRASSFIPQMYTKFRLHKEEFSQGLFFILNGLIKKMVIADYISINFVDRVFENPTTYSGLENLMAVYGYSIQIYCDFSGYTDIAIGLALWMGFRLSLNFNSPYKAANITDFWRRWHISLSSWLKDYLYVPLGGNRKGRIRTYINLFITMLIGGLWHGASLRFIIWGALHGIYLAIHKGFLQLFPKANGEKYRVFWVFVTFHIVAFTWMAFRASDMQMVMSMFDQIFHHFEGSHLWEMMLAYKAVWSLIALAFIIHWLPVKTKDWYRGYFVIMPMWLKVFITIVVIFILAQFSSAELQPFIYFQF